MPCIARPHGRARIETLAHTECGAHVGASPGLTAGRGLKPADRCQHPPLRAASPGLTAGRGLKPDVGLEPSAGPRGIARPHGRARIETSSSFLLAPNRRSIARPHGRARIETPRPSSACAGAAASPGLTAGRGLKRSARGDPPLRDRASPGLTAGRGLKLAVVVAVIRQGQASPGLTAGRGLKPWRQVRLSWRLAHRPASRPGAD